MSVGWEGDSAVRLLQNDCHDMHFFFVVNFYKLN